MYLGNVAYHVFQTMHSACVYEPEIMLDAQMQSRGNKPEPQQKQHQFGNPISAYRFKMSSADSFSRPKDTSFACTLSMCCTNLKIVSMQTNTV